MRFLRVNPSDRYEGKNWKISLSVMTAFLGKLAGRRFHAMDESDMRSNDQKDTTLFMFDDEAGIRALLSRLQNATNATQITGIIQDLCTLAGAEQAAIFKVDFEKGVLWMHWSYGMNPGDYPFLDLIGSSDLRRMLAGESLYDEEYKFVSLKAARAVIPIFVGGIVMAALVILKLRPDKQEFDAMDRKIFGMISYGSWRMFESH